MNGKNTYLVEKWVYRMVAFEVEAENEDKANALAAKTYANDPNLQELMKSDAAVAMEMVRVNKQLSGAEGKAD